MITLNCSPKKSDRHRGKCNTNAPPRECYLLTVSPIINALNSVVIGGSNTSQKRFKPSRRINLPHEDRRLRIVARWRSVA